MRVLFPVERRDIEGGMPRSISLLVKYVTEAGVSAGVLLPCLCKAAEFYRQAGAQIFITPSINEWTLAANSPWLSLKSIYRFRRDWRKIIKEYEPDVVHTNHLPAEIYVAAASSWSRYNPPRVFTQRGNIYAGISRRALKCALKGVERCIVTTDYQWDMTKRALGVPDSLLVKIPNFTDLHLRPSQSPSLRDRWNVRDNELLFAVVGFPCENKNQETFLKAANMVKHRLKNARFAIIGEAVHVTQRAYLKKLKEMVISMSLEDRVIFPGFHEDARAMMDAIDVLVSTSLREGFGRTIIEAWACKHPVISTRVDGPKCIVHHGKDGFLFAPKNAEELTDYMIKLDNPSLRTSMGKAGHKQVLEKYDARQVAGQYTSLYESVCKDTKI